MGPANEVFGRQQLHWSRRLKFWSKTLPLNGIYFVSALMESSRRSLIIILVNQIILCEWWESTAHTFCKHLHGEMHSLGERTSAWNVQPFPNQGPFTSWDLKTFAYYFANYKMRLAFFCERSLISLLTWVWFTCYLRKYILSAKHFFSGAATCHGFVKYDLPSRKYWWSAWHWVY